MTQQRTCSKCGAEISADAPKGLCEVCEDAAAAEPEPPQVGSAQDAPKSTIELKLPVTEEPGGRVGRYKLLQRIGEGGWGVVYMAEQLEPVKRRVALKVIKPGMDSRQVLARFEAERQALALMDHPHIAKVLDAGATESGRPFFVMELVRGIRLTDYCDQNNLSTERRLDLFIQICRAVQHAHQKGIIHRDIKPSNILVTLAEDGTPTPKVIDFGIAKATAGQTLTDKTLFTAFEQFIGTPAYMSPEQAEMTAIDIDTRSDIYSLGVLLYELLTGKTPFDATRLLRAGFDEIRRVIREEEPPRPSTRLTKMDAAEQTTVAKRRHCEFPKLIHQFRGDLDCIVMKALEKDRTLRYETANGLAMDVQRHLDNEPILARPASSWDRVVKWTKRRPAAAAMAAVVAGAAVACAVLAVYASRQALRAAQNARDAAAARTRAEATAKAEAIQRERAVQGEKVARQSFYVAQINLARQAWKDGNAKRVLELLEALKPKASEEDLRGFEWQYLLNLCHREESAWSCGGSISLCAFSRDGSLLANSFTNGLKLWDVASGKALGSLWFTQPGGGHTNEQREITSLAFAPDGKTLACVFETSDAAGRAVVLRPEGNAKRFSSVTLWRTESIRGELRADFESSSAATGTLNPLATLSTNLYPRSLGFSADGQLLAMGASPGVVVWDLKSNTERTNLTTGSMMGAVSSLSFSPDGSLLVATIGGALQAWDAITWKASAPAAKNLQDVERLKNLSPFEYVGEESIDRFCFSPDGKTLAAAIPSSGSLRLWDVATKAAVATLGEQSAIAAIAYAPDGKTIAIGSENTVRLWNAASGQPVTVLAGHVAPVTGLHFSADGTTLASLSNDGEVRLWEIDARGEAEVINYDGGLDVLSPTGDTIGATMDSTVDNSRTTSEFSLWDLKTHEQEIIQLGHSNGLSSWAFSPDGRKIATVGSDQSVEVWDLARAKRLAAISGAEKRLVAQARGVAFSLKGDFLAVVTPEGIRLLDADSLTNLWNLECVTTNPPVWKLVFLPKTDILASSTDSKTTLWDLHLPKREKTFEAKGSLFGVSPDGDTFATATRNSDGTTTLHLWSASAREERLKVDGFTRRLTSFIFSPDGRTVALSLDDGSARLLQTATGMELLTLPGRVQWSRFLGFTSDGSRLLSLSSGKINLWRSQPVPTGSLEAWVLRSEALQRAGRMGDAADAYYHAVELSPGDQKLWNRAGTLFAQANRVEEAYGAFSKAINAARGSNSLRVLGEALLKRSDLLARLGRHKESVEDCRQLLELPFPDADEASERAYKLLTDSVENRDPERALILAEKTKRLEPQNHGYDLIFGLAYYRLGQFPLARESLFGAVYGVMSPELALEVQLLLALTECQAGNRAAAQYYYQRALQRPRSPAEELLFGADWKEADKLLGGRPQAEAGRLCQSANALSRRAQMTEAIASFQEALDTLRNPLGKDYPGLAVVQTSLGRVLKNQGKLALAEAAYQEALTIQRRVLAAENPDVAETLVNLALIALEQGRSADAERLARDSLTVRQKKWPDDWRTLYTRGVLGSCLVAQKRHAEAEPLLISSYEDMKKGNPSYTQQLQEAIGRIVKLYESWEKPAQAAEWRTKLTPQEPAASGA